MSLGSKFCHAWKGLVHMHTHTKYESNTSRGLEVISKTQFQNLNAKSEVEVKVTGVKNLPCMERFCPHAQNNSKGLEVVSLF